MSWVFVCGAWVIRYRVPREGGGGCLGFEWMGVVFWTEEAYVEVWRPVSIPTFLRISKKAGFFTTTNIDQGDAGSFAMTCLATLPMTITSHTLIRDNHAHRLTLLAAFTGRERARG